MFRKTLLFGGLLLLAAAAVLVTPGSGQAQHRGGGGHSGGRPIGGFHGGAHSGGFHHGGFHHGGFHHGGRNWSYPRYYGYYPYSGYADYYPDTSSPDWSSPPYDSGYYGSYGDVTSSDARAQITVSVPADAEIWFEGTKMTSTGSVREYQSPPLTPGSRYTYDIRARWNENEHEVTQTQQVEFTAGTHVSVKFPVQLTKAPTAPSH
jgi:uncharacterized protein (TIGR03000 family)